MSYNDSQCQLYSVEAPVWRNGRGILAYQFSYSPPHVLRGALTCKAVHVVHNVDENSDKIVERYRNTHVK